MQNKTFVYVENATFIFWNIIKDSSYRNVGRFVKFISSVKVRLGKLFIPFKNSNTCYDNTTTQGDI